MANARDINLDIVGHDKTGRATRSAANNLDRLRKATERTDDSSTRYTKALDRVRSATAATAKLAARMAGAVALVGAAFPPVLFGLGKFAIAAVQAGKAIAGAAKAFAPAAAGILPLAAGFLFLKATIQAFGEEFLNAVKPMERAWQNATIAAGRLATAGIQPLARQFVKINFPAIRRAMNDIGKETNWVAKQMLAWTNSARGARVIRQITGDTSRLTKQLSERVVSASMALGELAGRASDPAFRNLGGALEWVSEKIVQVADSISQADVDDAFERIQQTGRDTVTMLRELRTNLTLLYGRIQAGVAFYQKHEAAITRVRTALATLAIIAGVATGGWMIALGGAAALIAMNWDKVSAAFERVKVRVQQFLTWVRGLDSVQATAKSVRDAVDQLREGFDHFVDSVRPKIQPFLDRVRDSFIRMQPLIAGVAAVMGVLGSAFLRVAGPVAGAIIEALGLVIEAFGHIATAVATLAAKVLRTFSAMIRPIATIAQKLGLPFADAFADAADNADTAAGNIESSLNSVKTDLAREEIRRLQSKIHSLQGKKVRTETDNAAIKASMDRIADLKGQIASVHGKTATVTVITRNITEYQNYRRGERGQAGFSRPKNATLGFATAGGIWGAPVGGAIMVKSGPTNVDARVYIDGREITAIARSTIHNEQSRAAYRARYGRRA